MSPLAVIQPGVSAPLPSLRPGIGPQAPGAIPIRELEEVGPPAIPATEGPTASFSSLLGQLVSDVNAKQAASSQAVSGLLAGDNVSLHQAMIAMQEASVSFQLMVEVRNKLMESYQELMRMAV